MPVRKVRGLLGSPDEVYPDGWVYNVDRQADGLFDACVTLELDTSRGRLTQVTLASDG